MVRLTIYLHDVKSCYLSLERSRDAWIDAVFQSLSGEVLDSADKLGFLQSTITYYDSLVENLVILFQSEVDYFAAAYYGLDCLVTKKLADQCFTFLGLQRIFAICSNSNASRRSFDHDGGSWNWLVILGVSNNARDDVCLSIQACNRKQHQNRSQQTLHN